MEDKGLIDNDFRPNFKGDHLRVRLNSRHSPRSRRQRRGYSSGPTWAPTPQWQSPQPRIQKALLSCQPGLKTATEAAKSTAAKANDPHLQGFSDTKGWAVPVTAVSLPGDPGHDHLPWEEPLSPSLSQGGLGSLSLSGQLPTISPPNTEPKPRTALHVA